MYIQGMKEVHHSLSFSLSLILCISAKGALYVHQKGPYVYVKRPYVYIKRGPVCMSKGALYGTEELGVAAKCPKEPYLFCLKSPIYLFKRALSIV